MNGAVGAGPLSGVKVIDLTAVVSGPFATQQLADLGAQIVKVEPPGIGDQSRYIGAGYPGYSALFATCNRNKRSIAIDLKTAAGVEVVLRLATQADVLIENFRPGVAERMGLGAAAVRARAPELIYASITGYGADGPHAGRRTYDVVIQAGSGLADAQGGGAGEPQLLHTILCDKVAGMSAAQAILAALYARARGENIGRRIEVSMLEATLAFNWPDVMWNHTFTAPDFQPGLEISDTYRLWKTRDGHVAAVFMTSGAFRNWCAALGAPAEIAAETFATEADSRLRWKALFPVWEALIANLDTVETVRRFHREGVPCGPVVRRGELRADPQVLHRDGIRNVPGGPHGEVRQPRPVARLSGLEPNLPMPAPRLGEHSRELLAEAGFSSDEVGQLLDEGVLHEG